MNLPEYECRSVLARSEHTILHRAIRRRDGRAVVLKGLAHAYPPLSALRRLELEHRVLARLRSPGVIEALELADEGGRPVLVLEDFGGENLALPPGERLPLARFLPLALALARALGDIHASGVIHKDIKPHNILQNRGTGVVKIIDFHLSTELAREGREASASSRLEGSLPYMSPEQTGRMNRSLDHRTDYYSLGVTFFQLLTGRLPLEASDMMGWVHAHLSKPPLEASAMSSTPRGLSRVVAKLLAKDADERYQSARGLIHDLERCRESFERGDADADFPLGDRDLSERFQVSERLVGREREVQTLLGVFERASGGPAELLLVHGRSGIGKSALIREVHKPIVAKNGYFVSGKFDQLERNLPYGALAQAVRQLVRQLLTGPEPQLQRVRERLLAALGGGARVLIEWLPELESVLGPQPTAPALKPNEDQYRFQGLMARLLGVFARPEHPLVVFLDDLQWTDASTPGLLTHLLSGEDLPHLLLILAYRGDEIGEGHLLPLAIRRIREARADSVHELMVEPLSGVSIARLCADSLHRSLADSAPLGELIAEKTAGNPFFATELLAELSRSGAISLGRDGVGWDFDLAAAQQARASDDVVALMLARLEGLAAPARRALSVAACLGNEFELAAVARLLDQSPPDAAAALWEPLARRLLVPQGDGYRLARGSVAAVAADELPVTYRFQHDRVQQVCHSLLDAEEQAQVHLRIGRLLLSEHDEAYVEEHVFDIVNHLNVARHLIPDAREREHLATLNARAAARAKRSTAYAIAANYLDTAIDLTPGDAAAAGHERRFERHAQRVECVLMAGDVARATRLATDLAHLAPNAVARGAVWLLEARILEAQARFSDAVDAVRSGLALFGITWPAEPDAIGQGIGAGIARMQAHLGRLSPEGLLGRPDLVDPEKLMAMNLLFHAIPSAIQTYPPLFILAELIMFDIAVEYGLTPASAKNFVDCGIIQGGILGDYDGAYRLGQVAFRVLSRFADQSIASSVHFVFGAYVSSWRAPYPEALEAFVECYRLGMETGDVQHMGFGTALRMHRLLHIGHDLEDCQRELEHAIAFLERSKLPSQRTAVVQVERALAKLRDRGASAERLAADDALATARVQASQNPQWIYAYAESQLVVSLLLGQLEEAETWRQMAAPHVASATALISVPEFHLAEALLLSRREWPRADAAERTRIVTAIRETCAKLDAWSKGCPDNFAHKYHLCAAELARVEGAPLEAVLEHLHQAADQTGKAFIQYRALALELEARLWQDRERPILASALLREALALYERWGAARKVAQLASEAGGASLARQSFALSTDSLSGTASPLRASSSRGVNVDVLDLAGIIKATLAISGEVRSEALFASLMSTLLENAAAQRGLLIIYDADGGAATIEAEADVAAAPRLGSRPPTGSDLCLGVLQLAARSREPVVVDDASADPVFGADPYVSARRARSLLCVPIVSQGRLVAAFYAENAATAKAFSPARVATLRLIASQAAISIENARLYASLESRIEQRTRELAERNREIAAMLDGMDQGVFMIDEELRILPRYSSYLPRLFGRQQLAGESFAPLLFEGSDVGDDQRAATEMGLRFSFGVKPQLAAVNFGHLVSSLSRPAPEGRTQHIEIAWKPVAGADGNVERFLVVARDVTLVRELRDEQRRNAREAETLSAMLAAGVDEVRELCVASRALLATARELVVTVREPSVSEVQRLFRALHTIKGNARSVGATALVDAAHAAESVLDRRGDEPPPLDRARLGRELERVAAALDELESIGRRRLGPLWAGGSHRLEHALGQIELALDGARAHPSQPAPALAAVSEALRRARGVPLDALVRDAARGVDSLAAELGKPSPLIESSGDGVALAADWARVLKDVLAHTLRNALDHGIEPPAERAARGKVPRGSIQVRAERRGDGLRLRLSDDGRGLALERLRRLRAAEESDEELAQAVFTHGVSTSETVSTVSGRGVGMDVVRRSVQERGGLVSLGFTGQEFAGHRPFELIIDLPADARLD